MSILNRFLYMGPICEISEYLTCHEQIKYSYFEFCKVTETVSNYDDTAVDFCKCYYLDILLNHCANYCVDGINSKTWNEIYQICAKSDISFEIEKRDVNSGLIINYGISQIVNNNKGDMEVLPLNLL